MPIRYPSLLTEFEKSSLKSYRHRLSHELEIANKYTERALFLFYPEHILRRTFIHIVEDVWFGRVMIMFIFFNTLLLIAQSGVQSDSLARTHTVALHRVDMFISAVFVAEMVSKVIACGFVMAGR